MTGMYDVAVVGAGPAGSAAALRVLQLRPDAHVLLLDAARFPRDKTCGDGVAAGVFDLLAALGVPDLAGLGGPVPRLHVRSSRGAVADRHCARPNRVVPRAVLDHALVAACVDRGVRLRRQRVRRVEAHPGHVVLDGDTAARTVIGTDGANSVVRRSLGIRSRPRDAAVAVRGYSPHAPVTPGALHIAFAEGRRPAYAWSFPLADGGANVGYGIFDGTAPTSRDELLAGLDAQLPGQELDPATVRGHRLPLSTGGRVQPDGRVLLAGDAAALVNPLTGEGIFDAVASGVLAGQAALCGAAAGAVHRASLRRCFGRHHRHTAALARLMRSPRFVHAAVLAAARDRAVFDDVVDVGLGRGVAHARTLAAIGAVFVWPGTGGRPSFSPGLLRPAATRA
ncbi:geranylgeranyl reductase family protein [Pseudonocardia sp. RS11V-5]|uniref:geranylgeranyl reductase family protein n=1 Tax=Pseudonocardia terrae TaxID=2905831 RepID=UPI001E4AC627|nr:geranylgeranyl reductase family protein [Pseudonocardia terrae]MCE3554359.1 geranylgeranyl reductase family protein [Pseudonocardia terrae]